MNCPYCGIKFSLDGVNADHSFPHFGQIHGGRSPYNEGDKEYTVTSHKCPECGKQIMWLNELAYKDGTSERFVVETTLLFPKYPIKQLPDEVPDSLANEFREAHQTLPVSPKASAALSRRCLQRLIREKENISGKTLFAEVEALLKLKKLPRYLADDLDAIRVVGNFAAHPIKDTNGGEIVDVEPGEAEWTLKVLEDLLLFYFVEEARSAARRDALNKKLHDSGKSKML
jgi:DNA-directed RNA polymerase subunit RPC12/RpoP